ncbi:MAG: hypothetical protein BYD32DRAFT_422229 [Podila humilis]|nr:MAG: hypothetical protein BYD32DRAFT_422229 [Podila humilis]
MVRWRVTCQLTFFILFFVVCGRVCTINTSPIFTQRIPFFPLFDLCLIAYFGGNCFFFLLYPS